MCSERIPSDASDILDKKSRCGQGRDGKGREGKGEKRGEIGLERKGTGGLASISKGKI